MKEEECIHSWEGLNRGRGYVNHYDFIAITGCTTSLLLDFLFWEICLIYLLRYYLPYPQSNIYNYLLYLDFEDLGFQLERVWRFVLAQYQLERVKL